MLRLCDRRTRDARRPAVTTWSGRCGSLGGLATSLGGWDGRWVGAGRGRRGGRRDARSLLASELEAALSARRRGASREETCGGGASSRLSPLSVVVSTVGGTVAVDTGPASVVVVGVCEDADVVRRGAVWRFLLSSLGWPVGLGCRLMCVRSVPLWVAAPPPRDGKSSSVRALGTVSSRSPSGSARLYISGSESIARPGSALLEGYAVARACGKTICSPCRRWSAIRVVGQQPVALAMAWHSDGLGLVSARRASRRQGERGRAEQIAAPCV
jgi:hypothetical protein